MGKDRIQNLDAHSGKWLRDIVNLYARDIACHWHPDNRYSLGRVICVRVGDARGVNYMAEGGCPMSAWPMSVCPMSKRPANGHRNDIKKMLFYLFNYRQYYHQLRPATRSDRRAGVAEKRS